MCPGPASPGERHHRTFDIHSRHKQSRQLVGAAICCRRHNSGLAVERVCRGVQTDECCMLQDVHCMSWTQRSRSGSTSAPAAAAARRTGPVPQQPPALAALQLPPPAAPDVHSDSVHSDEGLRTMCTASCRAPDKQACTLVLPFERYMQDVAQVQMGRTDLHLHILATDLVSSGPLPQQQPV
jgi:hypothetical protein